MTVHAALKRWGNSQGLIIPKKVLALVGWTTEDGLEIEVVNNELHIRKPFRHRTLGERLAEYDGELTIADFDWGEPLEGEAWW